MVSKDQMSLLEEAAASLPDTLYVNHVVDLLCRANRDAIKSYVEKHVKNKNIGDFLAGQVPPEFIEDLLLSTPLVEEGEIDALERLVDLIAVGLTQEQANSSAMSLMAWFAWKPLGLSPIDDYYYVFSYEDAKLCGGD